MGESLTRLALGLLGLALVLDATSSPSSSGYLSGPDPHPNLTLRLQEHLQDDLHPSGQRLEEASTAAGGPAEGGGGGGEDEGRGGLTHLVHTYLGGVVIPAIGVLGVLGNLLNLAILSWRCLKRDDDTLEKLALIGLISLAVSDMCFCFTIIPFGFVSKPRVLYERLSFDVYFHVYGQYAQNVFIKTSTWLTMIVATARYIAICHPLKARFCFGIKTTRLAIVSTYVFWAVLLLPMSWSLQIVTHSADNVTFYLIDHGAFAPTGHLHLAFTYVWAIVGYFLPVTILAFCNVRLIQALRESRRLRKSVAYTARGAGSQGAARKSSNRITLTLIALVLMFLVLISPSELLHFCLDTNPSSFATYEVLIVVTNVFQAFNFALHFVLYCAVNVTFRRTLVLLGLQCVRVVRRRGRHMAGSSPGRSYGHSTLSRRGTLTPSHAKSHETHI